MIDEELYRQAAEELGSERRRLDVWARACALANEDHDEARYLYTNLRAEALASERATSSAAGALAPAGAAPPRLSSAGPDPADVTSPDEDIGDEALFETGEITEIPDHAFDDESAGAAADAAAEALPASIPTLRRRRDPDPPGVHGLGDLDWLDEEYRAERRALDEPPPATAPSAEPDAGSDAFVRELERQARELPIGPRAGAVLDHEPGSPPSGAAAEADAFPDPHDGNERHAADEADEAAFGARARVDDDGAAGARGAAADPPVTEPVEAAHALGKAPTGRADRGPPDVAGADAARAASGSAPRETGRTSPLTRRGDALEGASRPDGVAGRDARDPDRAGHTLDDGEPLELDIGGREEYAVFTRAGSSPQTVRQGDSWGALLLTLPWLLYRHLVGTAIVYALFAALTLAGLALGGIAWFDGGAATPLPTRVASVAFALLALVGLFVVPLRYANHWREDKLERRGFELVAYVRAPSAERARAHVERTVDAAR